MTHPNPPDNPPASPSSDTTPPTAGEGFESSTPPPAPPNPVETPVPPAGQSDNPDRLSTLENVVNGLVDVVSKLVPKDVTPTRRPWTHRGSRND